MRKLFLTSSIVVTLLASAGGQQITVDTKNLDQTIESRSSDQSTE